MTYPFPRFSPLARISPLRALTFVALALAPPGRARPLSDRVPLAGRAIRDDRPGDAPARRARRLRRLRAALLEVSLALAPAQQRDRR